MVLDEGDIQVLGVRGSEALVRVVRCVDGHPMRRQLLIDGQAAFELSYRCGTCQALFERLDGANRTMSDPVLRPNLNNLDVIDQATVAAFGALLGRGKYAPVLLEVTPRLVWPMGRADYFSREQVATWSVEDFWSLPVSPHTPYYRTYETAVDPSAHLYEFLVPLVPPSWNDRERVAEYEDALGEGLRPTAVALGLLDVAAPAIERGETYYEHWALWHFLLDGHHKVEAAARLGLPIRLLSLISLGDSNATREQLASVSKVRRQAPSGRPDAQPRQPLPWDDTLVD